MRGWVIAVLLSFFIGTAAIPQCNYQLQYSGPYRASYFDLAVDGNDLWAATGYGLQLFDRTRSSMPQDAPQSLSREETTSLMAYIFSKNNFPSGEIDLSERGEMLGTIKYVATKP